MQVEQIPKSGAVIKAAVLCAGGFEAVAARFGIGLGTVYAWVNRGTIAARYVRPLSAMGGGVVTVEQLLAAVERTASEKEGAAA
jgi:hypothetical protein